MTRKEAWNRIDAIIEKHEVDDVYVTINNNKDYDALRFARKLLEQESCEDTISRQDAINANCYNCSIKANGDKCSKCDAVKAIEYLPPVNPQPKTGHWIKKDGYSDCSECSSHIVTEWDFCPKCGARMVAP